MASGTLVLEIDLEWLKAHQKEFLESFKNEYPNDKEDHGKRILIPVPFEMEDFEVGDKMFSVTYSDRIPEPGTKLYIKIYHDFSADLMVKLTEHIVKKLNRAKTYFETMKD